MHHHPPIPQTTVVRLPPPVVGWVIGKGGSRIKEMMTASNCRMCVPSFDRYSLYIPFSKRSKSLTTQQLIPPPPQKKKSYRTKQQPLVFVYHLLLRWVDQDVGPEEPRKLHLMGNKQQVSQSVSHDFLSLWLLSSSSSFFLHGSTDHVISSHIMTPTNTNVVWRHRPCHVISPLTS